MIEKNLAAILAKTLVPKLRDYVGKALELFERRLNEFDERIKAIPAGPQGEKGYPGESVVGPQGVPGESIVGPQGIPGESVVGPPGEPGVKGKDADPVDYPLIIGEVVPKCIRQIKEEIPSADAVAEMVRREVVDRVSLIPIPVNGKDGTDGEKGAPGEPGAIGPQGDRGISIKGDPGINGKDGQSIRGENGKDGSSLIVGEGPPMFTAKTGDAYLDSLTGDLYTSVMDVA